MKHKKHTHFLFKLLIADETFIETLEFRFYGILSRDYPKDRMKNLAILAQICCKCTTMVINGVFEFRFIDHPIKYSISEVLKVSQVTKVTASLVVG